MTTREDAEHALADILKALKAHEEYGPYYDDAELAQIAAERADLVQRLAVMEKEEVTE